MSDSRGSNHVFIYELPPASADSLVEDSGQVNTTVIVSCVLCAVFIVFAVSAHATRHVRLVRTSRPESSCVRWRCQLVRRPYLRHSDVFFPLFTCLVMLPLAQTVCVWRVHREAHASLPTLLVWCMVLCVAIGSAMLALVRYSMCAYYLHTSTSIFLVPSFVFLFEGASRSDLSGDVGVALCMMLVTTLNTFIPPLDLYADRGMMGAPSRRDDDLIQTELNSDDSAAENGATWTRPLNNAQFAAYPSAASTSSVARRWRSVKARAVRSLGKRSQPIQANIEIVRVDAPRAAAVVEAPLTVHAATRTVLDGNSDSDTDSNQTLNQPVAFSYENRLEDRHQRAEEMERFQRELDEAINSVDTVYELLDETSTGH